MKQKLDKLSYTPTTRTLRITLIFSVFLYFLSYFTLVDQIKKSNAPTIVAHQLYFSGSKLKEDYKIILSKNGMEFFQNAQTIDYIYMMGYSLTLCVLCLFSARAMKSLIQKRIGFLMAIFALVGALFDCVENAFILLSIQDPLGFPDWYAVGLSCFALIKWILLIFCFLWLVVSSLFHLFNKIFQKKITKEKKNKKQN
ncbi:hypothetical protein M0812_12943 [Anaeramoeba flamelloides]|uniref:Uncharacterized protein n=1 Tax=Anaeramoeba flamelloides TaxID=1746091 RepID=A0AAV7ZKH9_9EUKA|nr:hypothetical protein M0812_12943 [Anaeramoeba flamelloides]